MPHVSCEPLSAASYRDLSTSPAPTTPVTTWPPRRLTTMWLSSRSS